jgi:hypothetical protein
MSRNDSLDVFTRAAFEALFWSEGADDIGVDDLDQADFDEFVEDCKGFQGDFSHLFDKRERWNRGGDLEAAGHLFTLTRNRHGAGFWDGDYTPEAGRALTEGAHVYGTFGILVDEETGEFCCHR